MINKNDETAFPVPIGQTGEDRCGMSLRDWFAGMAMSGQLADSESDGSHRELADSSYRFADAMMEARKEAKK